MLRDLKFSPAYLGYRKGGVGERRGREERGGEGGGMRRRRRRGRREGRREK